ncbi:hypothetical protein [Nonomuraea sp. NPDC050643]|uniref:hypothetical protein n=1 Tax=Nonomuraea sp. NPDC050643 TaxID=3155660 RepID=UPI0033CADA23
MSAIVLALGLTGAGATPFIVQSASASVAAYDPVDPCDVEETCETTPEATVTVTTTLGTPTPEEEPETTVTKTVTASPTKATKAPTPKKSSTPPPAPTPETTPTQNPQPLPTQSVDVPPATSTSPTPEQSVEMPAIAPSETPPTTPPVSESQAASTEEVPLELRNAAPEFDQRTLTQKLSIPALVLVLLALFAVLIFEGRLRRMAHAAAVRKAGPHAGRPDAAPMGGGYPAGPGYATAGFPAPGYPGGTAYAPIISFVPVQTYPTGQPQYYQDPNHPYPPQGYVQEPPTAQAPPPEPVVLHPDEFDSYSHEPPRDRARDLFEPLVPAEPPPSDIPPGGASPYEGDQELPLAPAAAAEPGDSEPWQGQSLFEPAPREPGNYDPPPYLPADVPAEGEATVIQPLPEPPPQQEPTKEMPDSKRRRFGRKK